MAVFRTEALAASIEAIVMHDKADDSLEAALRLAAQKYGGKVGITGSGEFRERAARQAVRLGIKVTDADLQAVVVDEQAKRQSSQFNGKEYQKARPDSEMRRRGFGAVEHSLGAGITADIPTESVGKPLAASDNSMNEKSSAGLPKKQARQPTKRKDIDRGR